MKGITLSVIIPVYNAEVYLKECMDSVLRQNMKDMEIICVDDGSTDGSADVLKQYQSIDSRIHIFKQHNSGPARARNLGLAKSSGRYVCFLDADDYYCGKNRLRKLCQAAERQRAKVAACYMMECRYGHLAPKVAFQEIQLEDEEGAWVDFAAYQDDYNYQGYIYERSFLRENGISFPDYRRYEDPPFLLKVMQTAGKVWFVPFFLYCYRWGHQKSGIWGECWQDLLSGIEETYAMAAEAGENLLLERIVRRLDNDFFADLLRVACPELLARLLDIEKINLLSGHYLNIHLIQSMYEQLSLEAGETKQNNGADEWVFPHHLFTAGQRIVIYGAGDAGKNFYAQAKQEPVYVNVIAVIDARADEIEIPGMVLEKPQALCDMSYDAVLIAVENPDVAVDIREQLIKLGVDEGAIKWDGQSYRRRGFYGNFYFPRLAAWQKGKEGGI